MLFHLCFTKGKKKCFLKNLIPNGSLVNKKWFFNGVWRTFYSTFIFKSVVVLHPNLCYLNRRMSRCMLKYFLPKAISMELYCEILAWSFCLTGPRPSCRSVPGKLLLSYIIGLCFTIDVLFFLRVRPWCSWLSWNWSSWWIWSRCVDIFSI